MTGREYVSQNIPEDYKGKAELVQRVRGHRVLVKREGNRNVTLAGIMYHSRVSAYQYSLLQDGEVPRRGGGEMFIADISELSVFIEENPDVINQRFKEWTNNSS